VLTLDDAAAMNIADQKGRRFELSPQGQLSVVPLADSRHAAIASHIFAWLVLAGVPAEHVLQAVGVRIPGPDGTGGRLPDLTLWGRPQPPRVWLPVADLVLVVEIESSGSESIDEVVKLREYADAGIPRYWLIERDVSETVTLHVLGADGIYEVAAKMPLGWLLQTAPADHHLGG
jgi:Uma2 family endonuclease